MLELAHACKLPQLIITRHCYLGRLTVVKNWRVLEQLKCHFCSMVLKPPSVIYLHGSLVSYSFLFFSFVKQKYLQFSSRSVVSMTDTGTWNQRNRIWFCHCCSGIWYHACILLSNHCKCFARRNIFQRALLWYTSYLLEEHRRLTHLGPWYYKKKNNYELKKNWFTGC